MSPTIKCRFCHGLGVRKGVHFAKSDGARCWPCNGTGRIARRPKDTRPEHEIPGTSAFINAQIELLFGERK
jgi:hypothetical protein